MDNGVTIRKDAKMIKSYWKYDTALFSTTIFGLGYVLGTGEVLTGHTLEGILTGCFCLLGNIGFAKMAHYFRSKQAESYQRRELKWLKQTSS